MSDKAWKRTEREIAGILGGCRVPITGRTRGDAPDVAHAWLSVEVKHRRTIPGWLTEALDQARASQRDGQLPIAVLHEHRSPHADDLIVMRLCDFVDWFGAIRKNE